MEGSTIRIIRGTTNRFEVALQDNTGATYRLDAGEILRFGVKRYAEYDEYILCKTLTSDDLNESEDAYVLVLRPADTEDLDFAKYCYDIGLQIGDDYYNVIPCSDFFVEHNITKREG